MLFVFHFSLFTLQMLLAIDIGNSFTKFGFFEGDILLERINAPTIRTDTADEIYNPAFIDQIRAIVVSSVVPELNDAYLEFSRKHFRLEPVFVDNTFDFGLKIKYNPPENLGVDRIIAAFAAAEKYGAPCIVCDFGTAATIDAVNSHREFLGGVIAPGTRALGESLFLKTSKLPRVEFEKPRSVIGDSTVAAIQAGIFFGYIGLVEGVLRRILDEFGSEKPMIIATGGDARMIANECALIKTVDENLILDGLRLLYEKAKSR